MKTDKKKKKKSLIGKIISWIFFTFLVIVGAILVYYVINLKIAQKNGTVSEMKYSAYTIISGSMEPAIKVYDVVVDEKKDPSLLKVNDVITFISSDPYLKGTIITHRIKEIKIVDGKYEFKTKGDANQFADSSPAKGENIIGKVAFTIPQLGRIQFFIASRGGWFFLVLIPAFIIIGYDIVKLVRLINGSKNKNKDSNNINSKLPKIDTPKTPDFEAKNEEKELPIISKEYDDQNTISIYDEKLDEHYIPEKTNEVKEENYNDKIRDQYDDMSIEAIIARYDDIVNDSNYNQNSKKEYSEQNYDNCVTGDNYHYGALEDHQDNYYDSKAIDEDNVVYDHDLGKRLYDSNYDNTMDVDSYNYGLRENNYDLSSEMINNQKDSYIPSSDDTKYENFRDSELNNVDDEINNYINKIRDE